MSENIDVKHSRYADLHVPGEVFWGVGIENETYVEIPGGVEVPTTFLRLCQRRERYSVNYWTQFQEGSVRDVLDAWIAAEKTPPLVRLPLLINGHTFARCDRWGEHRTLYTKAGEPNPRFVGKTLLDDLEESEPDVFRSVKDGGARDRVWCFDGDTIEFMTQGFRNTTAEAAWDELIAAKSEWMSALRRHFEKGCVERLLRRGIPQWPAQNHGFAVFATNRNNVAIFNNGTFHLNLTAPTRLDKNGCIADWLAFRAVHQQVARLFQWFSPFLVARFGSADPFANLVSGCNGQRWTFPAGSQRLAASRYVSVGTYDTRTMPTGKLLTHPVSEMPTAAWWREMYARRGKRIAYIALDAIGYDINFNKFPNHGLEFRIFDWIPEIHLLEILRMCVWLFDLAIANPNKEVPVPQEDPVWRFWLGECVWEGASVLFDAPAADRFLRVLGIPGVDPQAIRAGKRFPVNTLYEQIVNRALQACAWSPGDAARHMLDHRRLPLIPSPKSLTCLRWMSCEIPPETKRTVHPVFVRRIRLPTKHTLNRNLDPSLDLHIVEPTEVEDTFLHPIRRCWRPTWPRGLFRRLRCSLSAAVTNMRTWLSRRSLRSGAPVHNPDSQKSTRLATIHSREARHRRVLVKAVLSL